MFLACTFSRKTDIKFQKCFCVTLFQKFATDYHLECLSYYKGMKRNLEFRKKAYFKKHLLINIQQNILPRTMEWLRDATNASEQDDSLLNKGLNYSFLYYNMCFFFQI